MACAVDLHLRRRQRGFVHRTRSDTRGRRRLAVLTTLAEEVATARGAPGPPGPGVLAVRRPRVARWCPGGARACAARCVRSLLSITSASTIAAMLLTLCAAWRKRRSMARTGKNECQPSRILKFALGGFRARSSSSRLTQPDPQQPQESLGLGAPRRSFVPVGHLRRFARHLHAAQNAAMRWTTQ